ncbi:MAG TPA: chemotaxis protein CheA [Opitutaceae bacterium]|nr:chemotaxis protein CheA [Opitutaceae bacterium]
MSSEFSPELRRELLDDFYAECDELLTAVREGLGQLDGIGSDSKPSEVVIEGLFRSTHSLKGISSIVGLRSAEQVAHAMEDVFRAVTKGTLQINADIVDTLLGAIQRLEDIVVAHRLGKDLPNADETLGGLKALSGSDNRESAMLASHSAESEAAPDPVAAARKRGRAIYLAKFSPSKELDARGINVSSVRARLASIGEVLKGTPQVKGKGMIEFEFLLAVDEAPADLAMWEKDNVRLEAVVSETASTPEQDAAAFSLTPSHIVRVDLARLDNLMRIVGQLVIQRSQLEDRLQHLGEAREVLKEVNLGINRSLKELRTAVSKVRMVPIAEIFARMPFVVRDLARDSDKKVQVVLEGQATEVDKYLVERIKEPLLHLVRNAFAHGIEPSAARVAAGKPAVATITLSARSSGQSVMIGIRDDGRGVDPGIVARKAAESGLTVPEHLDAFALVALLCTPGFSTQSEADMASGRGVGMAVVASTVRELGGSLRLESTVGSGTEFIMRLPLTLSIAEAIILTVAKGTYAVLQAEIDEILKVPAADVRTIKKTEVIPYRKGLLPLVRVRKSFGAEADKAEDITILVVSSETGATGLVVDRVKGQREIVIRPLSDPLLRVPGITGATELGDGRPVLIFDPHALTEGVTRPSEKARKVKENTPIQRT